MFATGNSQLAFVRALVERHREVPWAETVVFHMDEYVGVGPDHPAGFQRWIRQRIVEPAHPRGRVLCRGSGRRRGRVPPLQRALAQPSARPVLSRDRRKRAPRLQRPARGRLCRPPRCQSGRARCGVPHATGQRGPLHRPGRRPDARHHRHDPRALAGRPRAGVVPEARKAAPVRDALTGPIDTVVPRLGAADDLPAPRSTSSPTRRDCSPTEGPVAPGQPARSPVTSLRWWIGSWIM